MATETAPAAPPAAVPLTRAFEATIDDVSKGRRTVTARINTSGVDRYRTVILPAGGDFSAFMRSPAVQWEHGQDPTRGRIPVGHCTSMKYRRAEDDILSVTRFKSDAYSDEIFNDYLQGVLTAMSVDFLPDVGRSGRPTPEESRSRPDWKDANTIYRSWELTGYSAVSYPGNAEALATAVERGLWVPDAVRADLAARTMAEGSGAAGGYATGAAPKGKCRVCREDGRYMVRDEDDASQGGPYEVEGEARARCDRCNATPGRAAPAPPAAPATIPGPRRPEGERDLKMPEAAELAGLRTYTTAELAATVARHLTEPLMAATVAAIRDARDLARGRV